ncbi:MAG: DEAD/DEAH box helicase, partial [Oscillospiraceae bacterium]|nr:DEAD/DEAH box helicase [Oscillospiraceae bacterium]
VGFGKTEVALRAVFKCVLDGKQCAVLVPTTILAWQHYQTFTQRLEGYPVTVEFLSRFKTPREQDEIVKKVKRGLIDVLIGTHRIVQKDIAFKDLGLCIIDEEQRFGVAHKEKFKEMRANIDVLTLSATPIPRTLNMAMSGIRDMSLIEEAPQDRHPVQTYVLEHDIGVLTQAIQKELRRGGQVFYLHNRIESIDSCAARLKERLPDARIVTAHGKIGEEQLGDIWQRLVEHEIDVLVCTTIIETGVDVPNCNTLVIEDADRMGLSQLYQLRGRVGRSTRRAYAYLTFHKGKSLTDVASKRLAAIREFTAFGSGFRIAMRDLEIRGAGNILGAQQHGHMEAVGYDLYIRLLSEAVSEEQGITSKQPTECIIDLRLDAHIPEKYIGNTAQRIDIYKKIASVQNEADVLDITDELIDRFGDPPESVKGLVDIALLRNTASVLGIKEISQKENRIMLYPEVLDMEMAGNVASKMRGRVMVNAGAKPYFTVKMQNDQGPIDLIRETLQNMSS